MAYLVTPWGDDWEQAGTMAAEAHNAGVKFGGGKLHLPDDYIPRYDPTKPRRLTEEERLELEQRMAKARHTP